MLLKKKTMQAYKQWVRHNHLWVASIESIANTLTWFLPERFTNSEIGTEAVTSLIGLITAVNQHIIETTPKAPLHGHDVAVTQGITLPSDRGRNFPWPFCLSVTKELEVLIEVAAEQYLSRDGKWTMLATVEAIKALLRLHIFHETGYKLLIDGGETILTEGDPRLSSQESASFGFSTSRDRKKMPGHITPSSEDDTRGFESIGSSSGRDIESMAMKALSRFEESVQATGRPSWASSWEKTKENPVVIDEVASTSNSSRLTLLQTKGWPYYFFILGEVTSILRPLIFVLLIRRYGLCSWKPWVGSLIIDTTSMYILVTASKSSSKNSDVSSQQNRLNHHLSGIEMQELRRRQILWALYLLRDPFFSKYTRQRLEETERLIKPVPIFGMLAGKAVELIIGVQTRYTYTSAS